GLHLQGEHDETETDAPLYGDRFNAMMSAIRSYSFLKDAHFCFIKVNFTQNAYEDQINSFRQSYVNNNPDKNSWIEDDAVFPRKIDLPNDIKTNYPSDVPDDEHNSYEFHYNTSKKCFDRFVSLGLM